MTKVLAMNKLDRLAMSEIIATFLEKLPIKNMTEIRQSHNIYEGSGSLLGNEFLIQIKRCKNNKNVIVKKPGTIFLHPFNNLEDSEIAAHRLLKNILQ